MRKQNNANRSGKRLEKKCKLLLDKYDIPYTQCKGGPNGGIDFIIWPNTDDAIYLDCKSINVNGTAKERTPHTVYKYHHRYGISKIYILEGRINNPKDIRDYCNSICETKFIKLKDLEKIITGKSVNNPFDKWTK